jgi:hypothetical protein
MSALGGFPPFLTCTTTGKLHFGMTGLGDLQMALSAAASEGSKLWLLQTLE